MGFFKSILGKDQSQAIGEASEQYKDTLLDWKDSAFNIYNDGFDTARRDIESGIAAAHTALNAGGNNARRDITSGYSDAIASERAAMDRISSIYDPFIQSGTRAQEFYDTALGLNGKGAQSEFYDDYADNDPFREFRDEQANRAILAQANAAGVGGQGGMANIADGAGGGRTALAISRASLERGTDDLNGYLDRLEGQSSRGGQYAGQLSQFINSSAGRVGGYQSQQGRNLGQLEQQHATKLTDLYTNNSIGNGNIALAKGSTLGDAELNVGSALATNNANREIAQGEAKAMGANNLLKIGTSLAQMAAGLPPGSFGGGSSTTTPGTAANGGWSTTVTPAKSDYWGMFG